MPNCLETSLAFTLAAHSVQMTTADIHGDQLHMAVSFWYLVKMTLPTVHYHTDQVIFSKVLENTAMLNMSPCISGNRSKIGGGGLLNGLFKVIDWFIFIPNKYLKL